MNKKEFATELLNVRNILGHKFITDEYIYEFVNDYFKGWTEEAQVLLLKQLKKSNPAERGALSVDSILNQLVSIENNIIKDKYSESIQDNLAKLAKNKDTEKGKKASFILKLVNLTRCYEWQNVETFKEYMEYEKQGQFGREMILAYASSRTNGVVKVKQEKLDSFADRRDINY